VVKLKEKKFSLDKLIGMGRGRETVAIYSLLIALIIVSSIISPDFRTSRNGVNILRQAVLLGIVSIGQTLVILTGGLDLSVGSIISLSACLTSGIMLGRAELILPVVLLVLMVGTVIGMGNGLIVTRLKVPPFVATLGMMSIVQGSLLLYTKRAIGWVPTTFLFFADGQIGPVPFPVLFYVLLFLTFFVFLKKTTFGRYIYATGGGEEIARLSGIQTRFVVFITYALSGFLAALSGLFLASRLAMGDPLGGQGYELNSIATVLVGGTSLAGGRGGLMGTLAGVLIMTVVGNILNLMGVPGFWQWIVKGLIIIGAVSVYRRID